MITSLNHDITLKISITLYYP